MRVITSAHECRLHALPGFVDKDAVSETLGLVSRRWCGNDELSVCSKWDFKKQHSRLTPAQNANHANLPAETN